MNVDKRQRTLKLGKMPEWLIGTVLKMVRGAILSRVRIPLSPLRRHGVMAACHSSKVSVRVRVPLATFFLV